MEVCTASSQSFISAIALSRYSYFFAHIITSQRKLHFQPMTKESINRKLIEDFCTVQQDDYKLDFLSVIFQVWKKTVLDRMITVKKKQLNRFVSCGMSQVY